MDSLNEYNNQKKVDAIVWRSIPTTLAYWSWWIITIYLWQFMVMELDKSAAIGLGVSVLIWAVSKLLYLMIGINIIHLNLWDNCGCGCLAKIIAIPLLPYISILILAIWGYRSGSMNILISGVAIVMTWLAWFLLSYLDTFIDFNI
jgi:hypothetical protein